ncbi:MAG: AAA family ATPase, partial [Rhodothermales bacterium]|nr:AAA family ATPase [Rhodothermales bacterium]
LYAQLPLVYRRLFSVDPITDPGLAENRADDLGAVKDVLVRWSDGRGAGVLVVHGLLGSGRTSFLRLVDLEIRERFRTVRVSLDRRMTNEAELAAHLAAAVLPDVAFAGGFEELEQAIEEQVEERSTVVLVDNLEMALFQTPGGTDLLNRLLLFWIRTDDSVAWCASASTLAWQFAQKTASGASRLTIPLALTPWSTASIQEMVLKRHRRTGIALEFAPPKDPSPITKQRLKRARSVQEAQKILAAEFFDALYKIAGQSPTRALFEWIRAGTFSEDGTVLVLDPIKPISFGYLQQFENDIAFTMRSFILHNSLTVEEHAQLFRTSQAGSLMAFETLLSAGLIESLEPSKRVAIEAGVRYRVRRLVLEPVVRSLQERHFVY